VSDYIFLKLVFNANSATQLYHGEHRMNEL